MSIAYPNLLSPLKIRNTIFRNRLVTGPSMAHFIQGPEPYPSQAMIEYFAQKAKAGAAAVTVGCALPGKRFEETAHAAQFDYEDVRGQNYFSHLTEAIHFHGAKASFLIDAVDVPGWDVSEGQPAMRPGGAGFDVKTGKEITQEMLLDIVEQCAHQALIAKQCGFDMVFIHSSYRFFLISRFLSPLTNKRTDEFGGSLENRARFLKLICARIKELCGNDFLIEASISGQEPEGGITLDDVIGWTHYLNGYVDIMQIRAGEIDPNHPTTYNPEETPFLNYAAIIKASNPPMAISTIGGFRNFDTCESAIAEGKADLIAAARAWISNPDYARLAYENRPDDLVPCLRCNKCHIPSRGCTFNSVCSVNPTWGSIAARLPQAVTAPDRKYKVAVIGGGPAGMEAALVAKGRGHDVTLFEKDKELGGLLRHADNADFKWTVRDFKNFMIYQIGKQKVNVELNTEITPEMLAGKGYDHIIVAAGAMHFCPSIPGLDQISYYYADDVFVKDRKDELGENVVIIGGGEIGVDTGLYLAQAGHKVFVIEMQKALCIDATPVHYRVMVEDYWLAEKNFSFAVNAKCKEVTSDNVTYIDSNGETITVPANSIVIAAGLKPQTDLAMSYYGIAPYTTIIGDCNKPGSVQTAMRTGYEAGVKI